MSRSATSACAVVLLAALVAACDSDDNGTTSPQSTTPGGDTEASGKPPPRADTRAVKRLKACLRDGNAQVTSRVADVPRRARRASSGAFMATFPDATFGPQVDDVVFLPYAQPALAKKIFIFTNPRLDKRRRVMLRPTLLVIFGAQNTAQVSKLVVSCVGPPDDGSP